MSLLDINQSQVAAVMAPVINNQGTQATEQTLITVMNSQGTQATAALQAASNNLLTVIMNNQGTQTTSEVAEIATFTQVMNNQGTQASSANQEVEIGLLGSILNAQGTQSTANLATSAKQDTGNSLLTVVMNGQGTQATAALQGDSNALLAVIMNNQGTQVPLSDAAVLSVMMNNQGTQATSSKQDIQTTLLGLILNAHGTESTAGLATADNQSTSINNQGTLATSAKQDTGNDLLNLILNAQGTQSTSELATSANQAVELSYLSTVINNQGTQATTNLATSVNQTTGNALLTVVMNNQGTQSTSELATSSYQAVQLELLGLILNNQGTQSTSNLATSANQALANSSLTVIQNNQGTQATASNQSTEISLLSLILNSQGTQGAGQNTIIQQNAETVTTYGPTGTLASARVATLMTTDPNSVSVDAFGRLRVSNPDYRFDGQLVYQVSSDQWDFAWNGTGTLTYDRVNRMAQLTCAANGTSVLQSHYHAPYTPGRGQLAFVTFAGTAAPSADTYHRVGYFDELNGIYMERTSTGVSVGLKSSTQAGSELVAQASWNIDKMDGTGPSGITLDLTKSQILFIQLQALYIGRVIVGFDIDGVPWPVHQFTHANKFEKPYIANASLPVRYEVGSTGVNTAQLNPVCASVISEGGGPLIDIPARTFTAGNGATPISVNARRPVLSIRPKALFNQNQNEGIVLPSDLSIRNSTADLYVEVIRNGVLTGASWVNVDATNSVCEYDVSATAISGGQSLFSGYSNVSSGLSTSIKDNLLSRLTIVYSELLQTADIITIVCTSLGGAASTVAALNWKEIR